MATTKNKKPFTVWKPQPKQLQFMQRPEYEALYGGAAGGGKSDSLLVEALRQVDIPHYRGIIFRKTYPELSDLIDRSEELYTPAFPKAKYNDSKHFWKFPSGAKIYFGAMQHKKDRTKYQGKHFDFIGFDELTHFSWEEYSYMFSRNRPAKSPRSNKRTRVYIRATTNPGGIGHGWVKERFITAAEPMTPIVETVVIDKPDGTKMTVERDRIFVPATVFDNQILLEEDPNYVGSLALLPEKERNALLYGDWDTFSGQFFTEFRESPDLSQAKENGIDADADTLRRQRRFVHVIEPFDLNTVECRGWKIMRSYDFGYAKPFSCAWWAIDYDGTFYRIMELYGCTKMPNEGVMWTPDEQFKKIREIETTHPWLKNRNITGVADPAIWDKSRGESIADTAAKYGIYFTPGDHERLPGWMQCHYRLQFDNNGYSRCYIFSNCKAFIRTIPLMMYSDTNPEDLDTALEDHVADEFRYMCMSSPIKPQRPVPKEQILSDPLDQFKDKKGRKK